MTNVNEKPNITSTDERLQAIAERFKLGDDRFDCGEPNADLARFAAQKALEARDLLRQVIQKINKALES